MTCPMINQMGWYESARRRAEGVRRCPHDRLREAVRRRKNTKK